jgi:hypothetical protein
MHDAEVDERMAEEAETPTCSCSYCFCMARVEDGGWCADCRVHAHQG